LGCLGCEIWKWHTSNHPLHMCKTLLVIPFSAAILNFLEKGLVSTYGLVREVYIGNWKDSASMTWGCNGVGKTCWKKRKN
jgi:hypothetical protein